MRAVRDNLMSACGVAIAALLMTPALTGGPLVLDEHAAYWLCATDNPHSIWERHFRYAAVPPLMAWVQAGTLQMFGNSELALRAPSLLAFVVAVTVMSFGGAPLLGRLPAALAACALALHPDAVDEVRIGRAYGLVCLWMTLLLLLTLRWRGANPGWREAACWGCVAAAAVWTHILTIPSVAVAALLLAVFDFRKRRTVRFSTLVAWGVAFGLCVPLLPMGTRIWEWRHALNYQTGTTSLPQALGPFVWISLPIAMGALLLTFTTRGIVRRGSSGSTETLPESPPPVPMWPMVVMGLVPLIALYVAGQGDLSSLAQPRYRVPLAPAMACLLGVLCGHLGRPALSWGCLAVCLSVAWFVSDRNPWELHRLRTPQAPVWREIAEAMQQKIHHGNLSTAPVFVQSGLIEGVLIPAFPRDLGLHGYVASRLGRFYADTPNPRYALPLLWNPGSSDELLAFYANVLQPPQGEGPRDVFVAVATDTDLNRASFDTFAMILGKFGYKGAPLAGQEPWAAIYHYHRD